MMLLENNKKILIYGFESEQKSLLRNFSEKSNLPEPLNVEQEIGRMTIGDILSGLKIEVCNCILPKEKTIIFNNFSDEELDKAIKFIKDKFSPLPIIAVVTEMSINWTFEYLLKHLIEEREWFKAQNR